MPELKIDDEIVLKLLDIIDAGPLFELTDSCRPYLRKWLPWIDGIKSVENTRAFIEMTQKQFAANDGFQARGYGIKGIGPASSDSMG